MTKQRFPGLARCLRLMRSKSAARREDGFGWLKPRAQEFLAQLIDEFQREQDHGLRCWLLELIGEARDVRAFPVLLEELGSTDDALRSWAILGLQFMDTPDSRKALFAAGIKGSPHYAPEVR
jgi:hypothetical protein